MKPEFRIGEIRRDRTALPTIKELYKRQLDQFEQRTAQELGLSFYRLEHTASAAIAAKRQGVEISSSHRVYLMLSGSNQFARGVVFDIVRLIRWLFF